MCEVEGVGGGRGRLSLKGACCQPLSAANGSCGSARCCVSLADSARGESVCLHRMTNGNPGQLRAFPCSCSAY